MIDLSRSDALEKLADLVASRVAERLGLKAEQAFVSRRELSELTGLSVPSIDRMAAGGHWVKRPDGSREWRETLVKLRPIKQAGRTMFAKAESLAAIGQVGEIE
jgi:hypothetical protein